MASTNTEASPTPPATAFLPFFRTLPPLLPIHSWVSGPSAMNNDPGVQFVAARPRKRDHREMSQSHGRPPWRPEAEASSSSAHPRPSSSPPRPRYAGDGLDFRRPAPSASQDSIIDLTNEPDSPPQTFHSRLPARHSQIRRPRPPRFGRDIMAEVVDLEEEPEPSGSGQADAPSSPEVQFISASVRPPPSREPTFETNLLHMLRFHDPMIHGVPNRDVFRDEVARRARRMARHPPLDVDTVWVGGSGGAIDLTNFPLDMDYVLQSLTTPDRGPPPNAYKPPSPAPEGFTRTAGEDEVVCCPNCDAELGTGDETKQQIWVAKQCGHVYCGECATHRSKSSAKKAATQRVKPFSKCQVSDCAKSVSAPRAMFQIYL
ncbi:hypothetical protein P170DRAFT_513479 [Aspergillus steynii IBT 23096]|uniref:RING-type domain-containing protein n=1 Tax=Aspergillus steynii IBT 23096 TaxID=1392250 RepID=A0A2I2FUG6_9EURO|nr:uncharacterized protein P170DRAFT_513479 [Aspergillus steynii IBT 23096]PLB44264.1 hypothetical protein P170DRAFT_513479 [Aspergillus steynii IBT 23096]